MGMSTDEWRLLVLDAPTGAATGRQAGTTTAAGAHRRRGERHTAFIDHMPEHPERRIQAVATSGRTDTGGCSPWPRTGWPTGSSTVLTRIPRPPSRRRARLLLSRPADHGGTRGPSAVPQRWFHEAGPLRLDRYMHGGMGDVARMIVQ